MPCIGQKYNREMARPRELPRTVLLRACYEAKVKVEQDHGCLFEIAFLFRKLPPSPLCCDTERAEDISKSCSVRSGAQSTCHTVFPTSSQSGSSTVLHLKSLHISLVQLLSFFVLSLMEPVLRYLECKNVPETRLDQIGTWQSPWGPVKMWNKT